LRQTLRPKKELSIEHITKRSRTKRLQYHTRCKDKETIIAVKQRVNITAASHDGLLDVFSDRYALRVRKI
jgi:hypothetical protein